MFGIVTVAAITAICYVVGIAAKASDKISDELIPVIVGCAGGILGVIAFLTKMPDFPATDIVTAIAVGVVSGLAATGANQVVKQIKKANEVEG